jgi:hypothetical protein
MSTRGTRSTPAWPGGDESSGGVEGHLGALEPTDHTTRGFRRVGATSDGLPVPDHHGHRLRARLKEAEKPPVQA